MSDDVWTVGRLLAASRDATRSSVMKAVSYANVRSSASMLSKDGS